MVVLCEYHQRYTGSAVPYVIRNVLDGERTITHGICSHCATRLRDELKDDPTLPTALRSLLVNLSQRPQWKQPE